MADGTGESAGVFSGLTRIEKIIGVISAALLTIQTGLTIVTNRQTAVLDERIRQIEIGIKESAERREQANLNATITKQVFDELKSIVEKRDTKIVERVERLLVGDAYTSTIPDPGTRLGFKDAIKKLNDRTLATIDTALAQPETENRDQLLQQKAQLEDLAFSLDQDQAADRRQIVAVAEAPAAASEDAVRWSNYDFDIFWCDGTPKANEAKSLADELVKLRARDKAAAGKWSVRPLPRLTNLRPGYRVSGYEIRISSEDERPFGEQFAKEASDLLKSKGIPGSFVVRQTQQQTRWYLSVFVCPQ